MCARTRSGFVAIIALAVVSVVGCGDGRDDNSLLRPEVAAALTWCDDPLFDPDEDGAALCAAAAEAGAAGRIECVDLRHVPDVDGWCDGLGTDLSWLTPIDGPAPEVGEADEPPPPRAPVAEAPPAANADVGPVDAETGYPAKLTVIEWVEFGGCERANTCGRWVVFGDGRVVATRLDGEELAFGTIEPGLIRDLIGEADTDTDALVQALGPGPCRSTVDGVDHFLSIEPAGLRLDTCDVDLDADHALLRVAVTIAELAEVVAPIDWDQQPGG